MHFYTKIYTNY